MASPARMAGAGVLLLVLVAAVCAVLGGSSGVSATGLLQGQGASAAEATGLVFTAQVGRNVRLFTAGAPARRAARREELLGPAHACGRECRDPPPRPSWALLTLAVCLRRTRAKSSRV